MITRFDDKAILAIIKEAIALLAYSEAAEVKNAQEALLVIAATLELRTREHR